MLRSIGKQSGESVETVLLSYCLARLHYDLSPNWVFVSASTDWSGSFTWSWS